MKNWNKIFFDIPVLAKWKETLKFLERKIKEEELHMKTDPHTTVVLVDRRGSESIYLSPMEAWT